VKALPAPGMYIHFGVMAVLALMIIVGWRYRLAVALYGVAFTYVHLIDKSHYLNHYYLVSCLCALMAFLPLHRMWSLDARRDPSVRGATVPAWVVWALRAQIGLVYLFGGIAKLNHDWLVDAQPLTIWLSANTDFPIIGGLFDDPVTAYVFSYAGLVFDLTIVPLLLWRRSRPFAYLAVIAFHLITAKLFMLGMFPWIMMASSLVFLPPSWPRRFVAGDTTVPTAIANPRRRLVVGLLGAYFALHAVIPLRHWLYPGDRAWSEEGFRFSWNVMVMEKDGSLELRVREPATGRRWEVMPSKYLTRYQAKMAASQPDMILELAHVVAADFRARGVVDPEVRVDAFVSLNGRRRARLIDPDVDLAAQSDGLGPRPWILPEPENTP
jgi:vitamin K-dependent gamma-carboxylase